MKKMFRQLLAPSLVVLALLSICAGCATTNEKPAEAVFVPEVRVPAAQGPTETPVSVPPDAAAPPGAKTKAAESTFFTHTVRWRGESLSAIAAWYTGTVQNWRALSEANPRLANPNRISLGDRIRIPEGMLRTREPMPQGFVESYARPSKPPKTSEKPGEPLLFGPK